MLPNQSLCCWNRLWGCRLINGVLVLLDAGQFHNPQVGSRNRLLGAGCIDKQQHHRRQDQSLSGEKKLSGQHLMQTGNSLKCPSEPLPWPQGYATWPQRLNCFDPLCSPHHCCKFLSSVVQVFLSEYKSFFITTLNVLTGRVSAKCFQSPSWYLSESQASLRPAAANWVSKDKNTH